MLFKERVKKAYELAGHVSMFQAIWAWILGIPAVIGIATSGVAYVKQFDPLDAFIVGLVAFAATLAILVLARHLLAKKPIASVEAESRVIAAATGGGSFRLGLDHREVTTNGLERFCAITIENLESAELKALVKIVAGNVASNSNISLPFTLRTEAQILDQRQGRFTLSAEEPKVVPIFFRAPNRRNEWFLFDERGEKHFIPARSMWMRVSAYGGKKSESLTFDITVGPDWVVSVCAQGAPVEFVPLRDAANQLQTKLRNTQSAHVIAVLSQEADRDHAEVELEHYAARISRTVPVFGKRGPSLEHDRIPADQFAECVFRDGGSSLHPSGLSSRPRWTDLMITRHSLAQVLGDG